MLARMCAHTHTLTDEKLLTKIYNYDGNDLGRSERNDNSKLFSNHTEGVETARYLGMTQDWIRRWLLLVYI